MRYHNFGPLFQLATALAIAATSVLSHAGQACNQTHSLSTIDDLLVPEHTPFAIGHRGSGDNLGEDPDKPIENTIPSVTAAYDAGAKIIEVDVSITADNKAVVLHDDFLDDYTCVNTLTFDELKSINPVVPTLQQILRKAKHFARETPSSPQGLVIIEVKTPSPLCDPTDSTEQALMSSVLTAIDKTRTRQQVIIESFSPSLLRIAQTAAPDISRNLTMSTVQFLAQEQVEAITGLPVVPIDKSAGFGLQWAETGPLYRLPGYASITQYILTAHLLGVRIVTLDQQYLALAEQTQPGSATALIEQLKTMGMIVTSYTVETQAQWLFLEGLGIDGIFTNDVPMGVSLQR